MIAFFAIVLSLALGLAVHYWRYEPTWQRPL